MAGTGTAPCLLATLLAFAFASAFASACARSESANSAPASRSAEDAYAGSAACAPCHSTEYAAWSGSHHERAQAVLPASQRVPEPTAPAALEASREAPLAHDGTHLFLSTEGPNGTPERFPVAALIGVDPIVQYLIPAAGGRLQAASLSFDPRSKSWFDVFEADPRDPDEWGHWTGRGMTWNTQCAFCHMTRFEKRYDAANDTFASASAEAGVGCEACHGPRGDHVRSAASRPAPVPAPATRAERGFAGPKPPDPSIAVCASCHARRNQLGEGFVSDVGRADVEASFYDHFDPVLPDDEAFFADGQIRDEDYEWTSFKQSRMHARGVTCGNCHEPHSGKTRREGNALCLQCHTPALDSPAHTFHAGGSEGSKCTSCHMPETTYMMRHRRHDHSFSKPLPALTRLFGIPNACSRCHDDKSVAWAERAFDERYGKGVRPAERLARLMIQAREGRAAAVSGLTSMLGDPDAPEVWRASAASRLATWALRTDASDALVAAAHDASPLVRSRAVRTLAEGPIAHLTEALRDPSRLVRISSAWALRTRSSELARADRDVFEAARGEATRAALFNADRPSGRFELGLLSESTDRGAAERHYRAALALDARAVPARSNLAALLLEDGRVDDAIALCQEGIALTPDAAPLHFGLARAWAAKGRPADAVAELETTLRLDPRFPGAVSELNRAAREQGAPIGLHPSAPALSPP